MKYIIFLLACIMVQLPTIKGKIPSKGSTNCPAMVKPGDCEVYKMIPDYCIKCRHSCPCKDFKCQCCACNTCFPTGARVSLESGKSVTMSELKIGDKVKTGLQDGGVKYGEVKTFLKRQNDIIATYRSITTSCGKTIRLSGNHLIHARKDFHGKFNTMSSDQVSIGDEVPVQRNGNLIPSVIINITSIKMQGAYTPLTVDGNIMVDGILASCYAFPDHDLAQIGTTPIRYFPEIIEWTFGDDHNRWQVYATIAENLRKWVLPLEIY